MAQAPNRSFDSTLLAATLVATNAVQKSSVLTIPASAGDIGYTFFVDSGRVKAGATTLTAAPEFRIEANPTLADESQWREVALWTTSNHNVAVGSQTVTGTVPAGSSTIPVAALTGIGQGDQVCVYTEGAEAAAEFGRVRSSAGTTILLIDALNAAHTVTGASVFMTDQAEWWQVDVFPVGQQRLRFVADNAKNTVSTGGGVIVRCNVGKMVSIG